MLFSSFLNADDTLQGLGYQRLGASLGGCLDRNFWLSVEDEAVITGHEVWGDPLQQYLASTDAASHALMPALISIFRSQYPHLTHQECEAKALERALTLGFAPVEEG